MYYTLELPWGFKHPDVQYWKNYKTHVYRGTILPRELRPYASADFSYSRWIEDELNGDVRTPESGNTEYKPHDHQKEAIAKIFDSYQKGFRGFLLADKAGVGKTLAGLGAITAIARKAGFTVEEKAKVLIVCPKSVIPQWRQTIHNFKAAQNVMRPMIINYQQLNKLLSAPSTAKVAKKTRTKNRQTSQKGKPTIDWDYIIFDESHYLKNYPTSTVSLSASNLAQLDKVYSRGRSPFVLFSTATPGSSPLNMAIMSGLIAPLLAKGAKVTPKTWGQFLADHGFNVTKGKTGWRWITVAGFGKNSDDPAERQKYELANNKAKQLQRKDSLRIGKALISQGAPFIMRSPKDIAGWPEQQLIPFPIEVNAAQRNVYEEAWTRFRNWLRMSPAKQDPKGALVESLRYRQKSSLIKVEPMIDFVMDTLESGNQVYISVEFIETLDRYKQLLTEKKVQVSEISGRNVADRNAERIAFQKGETQVVLSTVVEGISLHAGEILPDGTKATSTPRVTIIHEVRGDPNKTVQSMGRSQRDGQNSLTYFPYLERTVDEAVISSFINKYANMRTMTGESTEEIDFTEKLFRDAANKTTPPNRLS